MGGTRATAGDGGLALDTAGRLDGWTAGRTDRNGAGPWRRAGGSRQAHGVTPLRHARLHDTDIVHVAGRTAVVAGRARPVGAPPPAGSDPGVGARPGRGGVVVPGVRRSRPPHRATRPSEGVLHERVSATGVSATVSHPSRRAAGSVACATPTGHDPVALPRHASSGHVPVAAPRRVRARAQPVRGVRPPRRSATMAARPVRPRARSVVSLVRRHRRDRLWPS